MVFTDYVDPNPDILMNASNPYYTFTHSIIDNGFSPLTDTILSAGISIGLRDDQLGDPTETVNINLDGVDRGTFVVPLWGVNLLQVDAALLQSDGLLQVILRRVEGDFYFRDSTLAAAAWREVAAVPQPVPLLLLGSGLVALSVGSWLRRRVH